MSVIGLRRELREDEVRGCKVGDIVSRLRIARAQFGPPAEPDGRPSDGWKRVPDAVQRDARSASWCTADPGPPQTPSPAAAGTELLAVPGLQRTTLGSALRAAPRLLRCARDTEAKTNARRGVYKLVSLPLAMGWLVGWPVGEPPGGSSVTASTASVVMRAARSGGTVRRTGWPGAIRPSEWGRSPGGMSHSSIERWSLVNNAAGMTIMLLPS